MSPRLLVIQLLDRWETTDAYADLLLDKTLKEKSLPARDKGLVQEIFLGVIRWQKQLEWIVKQFFKGKFSKSPRFVKYILLSSIYQLAFLDRVPSYAVINEAVNLAKRKGGKYWAGKVNGILRSYLKNKETIVYPNKNTSTVDYIAIRYSHPEWLVEKWITQWGVEQTIELCEANNQRPLLTMRVNCSKIDPVNFEKKISSLNQNVEKSQYNDCFFRTPDLPELTEFSYFQEGHFSIQDESAGLPCKLIDPKAGEVVLDLCAAPGGKSAYLSELNAGKAIIISIDQNFPRLNLIRKNIKRLGLKNIHLIQADGRNFAAKKADKVLVDAPCSGLGVLAKRVDLRWKRTPAQINELTKIQFALLQNAGKLVKTGGVVVYSTCTIEPDENERIVEKFLKKNKNFNIDPATRFISETFVTEEGFARTFPHKHGMDGSFAARLIKKSEI